MKNNKQPATWNLQSSLLSLLMMKKRPLTFLVDETAWRGNGKGRMILEQKGEGGPKREISKHQKVQGRVCRFVDAWLL